MVCSKINAIVRPRSCKDGRKLLHVMPYPVHPPRRPSIVFRGVNETDIIISIHYVTLVRDPHASLSNYKYFFPVTFRGNRVLNLSAVTQDLLYIPLDMHSHATTAMDDALVSVCN